MNDMVDMSRFVEAKSDQLNADDLIGAPRTITITRVTGNDGDQPVSIFYQGDNGKPFKPCKTIRRILMGVWGRYANEYVGKSMTLYRDDSVQFGGLATGGIRISHMSGIDKETVVVVMKSKGKKAGVKILPLKVEQQQERQQQPDTDAAANWTKRYISNVEKCADIDELVKLENSQAVRLAELKEKRPELHKQITDASTARGAAVSKEGKPDENTGEGFTDDAGEGPF